MNGIALVDDPVLTLSAALTRCLDVCSEDKGSGHCRADFVDQANRPLQYMYIK